MFLPHLARLIAIRPQPYILFVVLGLFLGVIGFTLNLFCQLHAEQRKIDHEQVLQCAPHLIDRWADVVFDSESENRKDWLSEVHSLMTRKAAAKFDKLFLPLGEDIYLKQHVSLAPWRFTSYSYPYPELGQNHQEFFQGNFVVIDKKNCVHVYRRLILIAVSRDDMRFQEFHAEFKVKKKHGQILISDIDITNIQNGTTYEQFLNEAYKIDSVEQFKKNIAALDSYNPDPLLCKAPGPKADEEAISKAINLSPKFGLAYYLRAKLYHSQSKFKLAEKDLDTAVKLCPGFKFLRFALPGTY